MITRHPSWRTIGRPALLLAVPIVVWVGALPLSSPMALLASTRDGSPPPVGVSTPTDACPDGGRVIQPTNALQPFVDRAAPGAVLCLTAGVYEGPVVIRSAIRLLGSAAAVIHSDGTG